MNFISSLLIRIAVIAIAIALILTQNTLRDVRKQVSELTQRIEELEQR